MAALRELARAKVNLTLEVAGRRPDGFHEIASLVAFADIGDEVVFDLSGPSRLDVSGPFAGDLVGENVLLRALDLIHVAAPDLRRGSVRLDKRLPVAAGVGGGSADAAAVLRAVRRANPDVAGRLDWVALARRLGADVAACFESRSLWMTGIGHDLADLHGVLPQLAGVLVNPMADVPGDKTVQVYRQLGAGPLAADYQPPAPPRLDGRDALLDFMRSRGNDLTRAALAVVPEAGVVLASLSGQTDVLYVAMSGGGPTCFGVFPDLASAAAARDRIAAARPDWWAVATTLG